MERSRTGVTRHSTTDISKPAVVTPTLLDDATLANQLTPRGLFTNLFKVAMPAGSLGSVRVAPTDKAQKEEFDDRHRPTFYQSSDRVYAFGPGLDDFEDVRFTRAIVTPDTDRNFTKYLLRCGLMALLRERGFALRPEASGFSLIDHDQVIASSRKGILHIVPQFSFHPYWVETTAGSVKFAFAVEVGTTTLPTFQIGSALREHAARIVGIRLKLTTDGCREGCVLHGRVGRVVGVFRGFAEPNASLDCRCHEGAFDPIAIEVLDRSGGARRKRQKSGTAVVERTLTIPGQLVVPAPGQRRLLGLFAEKFALERAGRVWLGDLTTHGKVRSGALQVRYSRVQALLARLTGEPTGALSFTLPTGGQVRIERLPISVEEIAEATQND